MSEYLEKLYQEFYEIHKAEVNEKNKRKLFYKWLEEKKNILRYYEEFLETMDFIPRRGVIELYKSGYDSILPYTSIDVLGILVSQYYDTYVFDREKRIVGVDGKILLDDKDVLLKYDNKRRKLDFINFYVTQFPIEQETINLLANISLKNKNIFIGTYGNLNDMDYELNLKKLYYLKEELKTYLGKNIEGEIVKTSDYYLAAITPKFKYKKIKN